jgi:hypothetical protein
MKNSILLIISFVPLFALAQIAERETLASNGGFGNNVSFTIGEVVVASNNQVTQGFQQSSNTNVSIDEVSLGFAMNAYPNPTANALILDFSADQPLQISLDLFDIQGRQMLPAEQLKINGNMLHSIDLSGFAAGKYILSLSNNTGTLNKSMQIQKVD